MDVRTDTWRWSSSSTFSFQFPSSAPFWKGGGSFEEWTAFDDMIEWQEFRVLESFVHPDTLVAEDIHAPWARELHIYTPDNDAASFGFFWDVGADVLYRMGLWRRGQCPNADFVKAASLELGF